MLCSEACGCDHNLRLQRYIGPLETRLVDFVPLPGYITFAIYMLISWNRFAKMALSFLLTNNSYKMALSFILLLLFILNLVL